MIEIRPGFERLLAALERQGIPYAVGGSLASSVHGVPRSTVDINLVVEMKQTQVGDFVAELRDAFYADEGMIRSALASKRSFNLIDMASGYKFDFFPLPDGLYYQTEFQRRGGVPAGNHSAPIFSSLPGGFNPHQARLVPRWGRSFGPPVERRSGNLGGAGCAIGS